MPEADLERIKRDFAALIKPYEDILLAGALRFTGNRADAEDLLQETFMRAFVGYRRSQDIANPKAWLFRIMRNAYINRYHQAKREAANVSYEDTVEGMVSEAFASSEDSPEEKFFSQFLDSEIEQALNSLPEQFRETVILCDVSGLSYEEASEVLDCPVGTVRSRLSRGRETLFEKLYEYARERGLLPKGEKGIGG
jgi:RNA polymerase sigma-70 factor (ECF subfamily)